MKLVETQLLTRIRCCWNEDFLFLKGLTSHRRHFFHFGRFLPPCNRTVDWNFLAITEKKNVPRSSLLRGCFFSAPGFRNVANVFLMADRCRFGASLSVHLDDTRPSRLIGRVGLVSQSFQSAIIMKKGRKIDSPKLESIKQLAYICAVFRNRKKT